jgi:hypothetical protein
MLAHRVLCVISGMQMVRMRQVRVMSRLFVVAFAVMAGRFAMMMRCL